MDKNTFLESFSEQFDETPKEEISFDTKYKDLLEWSSMMALVIIAFVDEKYNVSLKGDDFANSTTVEDLYNIINTKTNAA